MKKERNDLKAGVFILISLALIVAVVIGIKGMGRILEPSRDATITFKLTDDLGGLRLGDDIRIGGFKVGVVRDIQIVEQAAGAQPHMVVTASVPSKYTIRRDARATVQSTLTGSAWLNFDNLGSPGAPPLAPGERLVGRPSVMNALLASAGEIAPDLRDTVRDVRTTTLPKVNATIDTYQTTGRHATALVKYVRSKIEPITERVLAIAEAGRDAAGHIRDVFGESKGDFKTTMSNISAATGTVREKLPPIMDKVDGTMTRVQGALESATVALEDVKQVAANAKDVSASARSIVTGNRGKIDAMVASLKTTGDNLKFASAEIRHSPWRLLYKPQPGEVANLNLYDSARQFAEGAGQLSEAATALRDALQDPNVTQEHVQKLIDRLDKSFSGFSEIEQALWKQVK